jgi:hypothetical protein
VIVFLETGDRRQGMSPGGGERREKDRRVKENLFMPLLMTVCAAKSHIDHTQEPSNSWEKCEMKSRKTEELVAFGGRRDRRSDRDRDMWRGSRLQFILIQSPKKALPQEKELIRFNHRDEVSEEFMSIVLTSKERSKE